MGYTPGTLASTVLLQPVPSRPQQVINYILGGIEDVVTTGFALVVAVLIVLVGIKVGDYVADKVEGSETAEKLPVSGVAHELSKALVVLVAAVIAVNVAGIHHSLVNTVLLVIVLPFGLAAAIAFGVAVGYGSQDYVQERIEGWRSD